MELSVYLLLVVTLVLLGLTLLLFFSAVVVRIRNHIWTKKYKEYKKNLLPKVLEYLDEGEPEEIEKSLSGAKLEYHAFERIISDMLTEVEGNDADRLKELLYIDPIFNYHFKLLNSKDDPSRIKACNYFSNIRLVNFKVIDKLKDFLDSSNLMLAFSAASALMSSKKIEIRADALRSLAKNRNVTEMALLELFYKYHDEEEKQNEQEAEALKSLLSDADIHPENRALLVKGVTEIGYYSLVPFLFDMLKKPDTFDNNPELLEALIKAQGEFNNVQSIPTLRQYLNHESPKVVMAAIKELSDYGSHKDFPAFYNLLLHRDDEVKEAAVNALLKNEESVDKLLRWVPDHEKKVIERLTDKFFTKLERKDSQ